MFKTPEDVLKPYATRDADWVNGLETGISKAFESFAERVTFYNRYRDNKQLLEQEKPKAHESYLKSGEPDNIDFYSLKKHYDDWLFDHCFSGILEG